jgi:predicted RND superfamily exporter protein
MWMVFISLLPNIFPLLLTAGMMGWCGIELNGSSSIIFTISFVIAVDDTIHFLSKFKWERDKGLAVNDAIYQTLQHTGKSILITSLILAFGYSAAIFSVFREAYYHGVLICFTLLCAVFADLFLLPVFLSWRKKSA